MRMYVWVCVQTLTLYFAQATNTGFMATIEDKLEMKIELGNGRVMNTCCL
jgi:hypothetical protein